MAFTVSLNEFGGKVEAEVSDHVSPDGWNNNKWDHVGVNASHQGSWLKEGDEADPKWNWDGCQFRLPSGSGVELAVNVKVTGRKVHFTQHQGTRVRVQVEFVGHCEPSTFTGGWLTLNAKRPESNYTL